MLILLVVVALGLGAGGAVASDTARIVYVGETDDSFYMPRPVYTGLSLRDHQRPLAALDTALRGTRVLSRALGLDFAVDVVLTDPYAPAVDAVRDAFAAGALAVLLDLPEPAFQSVLSAGPAAGPMINIRHRDDRWRGADCVAGLLHSMPSRAMLADALAQYLRARGWDRVLLLHGDSLADQAEVGAARHAISKFGLRLAGDRLFELTNDPRRRDQSNIALLTGGLRHDVIWLIDNDGEFGRYVPYATFDPRPVVGSEGLRPLAWHWTYERHGAPQLNQRFRRAAGRDMVSEDWAAWVAVQAVVTAVSRVGATDRDAVARYLQSDDLSLDLYKGVSGSFRKWDGQLRQPILLATHNAVIATAPLDGFEHQFDTLDTLGEDASDTACERRDK